MKVKEILALIPEYEEIIIQEVTKDYKETGGDVKYAWLIERKENRDKLNLPLEREVDCIYADFDIHGACLNLIIIEE